MIIPPEAIEALKQGKLITISQKRLPHDMLNERDKYGYPICEVRNKITDRARYVKGRRYGVRKDAGSRTCLMVICEGIAPYSDDIWRVTIRKCGG